MATAYEKNKPAPVCDINTEYAKYAGMDEYTLFNKVITTNFGKTTNIDSLVNSIYWIHSLKYMDGFPIEMHIEHQQCIMSILEKFGPSYKAFKHLNSVSRPIDGEGHYNITGRTGFMSSLLINCQFLLYDYFLDRDVEANVFDDSFVIFLKLRNIDINMMPEEEIEAIKNIFRKYKEICPECPFVNSAGFEEFIDIYSRCASTINKKEWYIRQFGTRYDFTRIIETCGIRPINELINRDKKYYQTKDAEDLIFRSHWEYYPVYYVIFLDKTRDVSPEFMRRVRDFLIGVSPIYNKYLKYKMKYLSLKKH